MDKTDKVVARNRKAFHDYEVLEKFEAGVALTGSEVKAVRDGRINLLDCYGECTDRGEVLINHLHIGMVGREGFFTHEPYRKRKLLLHRKQIRYLRDEVERKRLTLIPLQVYFKEQWVKIELGLCRGRRQYDKREKIAEQESKRRLDILVKARRR